MNRKRAASAAHSHPRGVYPGGITASLHIAAPPVRRMFPPFFLLGAAMGADAPKGVAGPGGLIPGSARWGMCCSNFNKPSGAVSRGSPQFSQKFLRSAGNFRQKRTTPQLGLRRLNMARSWALCRPPASGGGDITVPARPPPPQWRGRGRSVVPPASGGGISLFQLGLRRPDGAVVGALPFPPPAAGGYHCSSSASAASMARKRGIMPILSGVWTGS
jgi:hypothetical protein